MKLLLVPMMAFVSLSSGSTPQEPEKAPAKQEVSASERAFQELGSELRALAPKNAQEFQEKFPAYIKLVKEKLGEFAKKFPGTDEAYEARFQIAEIALEIDKDLAGAMNSFEEIARESAQDENLNEIHARALFQIGQAQFSFEKYEEAAVAFQKLTQAFPLSPYAAAAKDTMAEIETLSKLAIGNPPIPFDATDLDGNKVSPSSFQGKVLLLDFWATWCPPCRTELPHLKATYGAFQGQGFQILGISLDKEGQLEKLKKFLAKEQIVWPQVYDGKFWDSAVAKLYGIRSIPATYLIDRKGKIRYKDLRGEELKKRVAELLSES